MLCLGVGTSDYVTLLMAPIAHSRNASGAPLLLKQHLDRQTIIHRFAAPAGCGGPNVYRLVMEVTEVMGVMQDRRDAVDGFAMASAPCARKLSAIMPSASARRVRTGGNLAAFATVDPSAEGF